MPPVEQQKRCVRAQCRRGEFVGDTVRPWAARVCMDTEVDARGRQDGVHSISLVSCEIAVGKISTAGRRKLKCACVCASSREGTTRTVGSVGHDAPRWSRVTVVKRGR